MNAATGVQYTPAGAPFSTPKNSTPKADARTCIVVLGMHRSGTSAITRIVNILGAALPRHVLAAEPSNEAGHWEPSRLVEFHDEVLTELDSAWHDWTPLDVSRLSARRCAEIKTRIAEIIDDEYGTASPIVVKDPRVCRFAPVFLEALTDAGLDPECVLIFRNPVEVVRSLARRDGMQRGQAGLLWLRHVLDSEAATRGNRRIVLFYGDLLKDWRDELRHAAVGGEPSRASVWADPTEDAAAQIDGFLNPAQRHHVLSAADIIADPFTSGWIADIHDALHQLRRDPMSAAALATFDRVRREFDTATPVINQMHRDVSTWFQDLSRRQLLAQLGPLGRRDGEFSPLSGDQEAIPASVSGRLTALLVRVLERATPGQRNFLLLCLRWGWRVATPWKIPARLRLARDDCRAAGSEIRDT